MIGRLSNARIGTLSYSDFVVRRCAIAFTLVEVMVAVGVFGISVIGMNAMIAAQWNIIRKTREELYVSQILESGIEEMRNLPFQQHPGHPIRS